MLPFERLLPLLAVFLAFTAHAETRDAEAKSNTPPAVDLIWGVKIPMRDGVLLGATVYRPHDQRDPLPVLFEMHPYISAPWEEPAFYFARRGYVFVIVDSRGRGNSEGKFNPFFQDPPDGYDTVEWLAKQPWSNGKIAMWGGSYFGSNRHGSCSPELARNIRCNRQRKRSSRGSAWRLIRLRQPEMSHRRSGVY